MTADATVFETDTHSIVERAMHSLGISWTVITVSVNDVDIKDNTYQTRRNVAESCDRLVNEYAEKIRSGDAFPMIVIEEKSAGRFRVVAGRHRASAYGKAQNGKTSYGAYLVEKSTPKELLFALSARENNANGVRQDSSDTARFAASKLVELSLPQGARVHKQQIVKSYAELYGANMKTVKDYYYARLVEREMLRVGVNHLGVPVSALHVLWQWTDSADWKRVALAVAENRSLPRITHIVREAKRDKLDALALIDRIQEAAATAGNKFANTSVAKDPATVTLEHLSLALNDLRGLAPPRNLPEEQAEDISSMVEAIKIAVKEWRSR